MKFSPKCNTKSDIGKFVIKLGNFGQYLGKIGANYQPQIWPRKIPAAVRWITCTWLLISTKTAGEIAVYFTWFYRAVVRCFDGVFAVMAAISITRNSENYKTDNIS